MVDDIEALIDRALDPDVGWSEIRDLVVEHPELMAASVIAALDARRTAACAVGDEGFGHAITQLKDVLESWTTLSTEQLTSLEIDVVPDGVADAAEARDRFLDSGDPRDAVTAALTWRSVVE